MQFYAVLNGDTLEFQKKKPETGRYVEYCSEKKYTIVPWCRFTRNVRSVRFLDKISPEKIACWFADMTRLEHFDSTNLDLSNVVDIDGAFKDCSSLTALDLSGWDVSGVSDMAALFYGCEKLREVNLSGWRMPKVQCGSLAFAFCRNLEKLDLSMLPADYLCNLADMFVQCHALKTLKLPTIPSDIQISEAVHMFRGCPNLRDIYFYGTNPFQNDVFLQELEQCQSLTSIHITGI